MKRFLLLLTFAFCLPFLCAPSTSLETRLETSIHGRGPEQELSVGPRLAYSVLFFLSDDIGDEGITAACAGDCATNMPTIDTLRSNGISFTNTAVTATCAATRSTFVTGRQLWQHSVSLGNGSYAIQSEFNFGYALRISGTGYQSGMFGKMGINDVTNDSYEYARMGLDRFWGRVNFSAGTWFGYTAEEGDFPNATTDASHVSNYLGDDEYDEATTWIQGLTTGQKFVAYVWPHHAHDGSYHDPPGSTCGGAIPCDDGDEVCDHNSGDAGCQIDEARYMDTKMGEVLTAALAHDPNTLVIYVLDNGDGIAINPGGVNPCKGTLYECGYMGESIFAYGDIPSGSKGTTSTEPIMAADFWPTMADYADVRNVLPSDRRGYSIRNLLSGTCTTTGQRYGGCWSGAPRCVYSWGPQGQRGMKCETAATTGYKYLIDFDGTDPLIYEIAVSETVECSDSSCDAAEAELSVLLPNYDGLPGPS